MKLNSIRLGINFVIKNYISKTYSVKDVKNVDEVELVNIS